MKTHWAIAFLALATAACGFNTRSGSFECVNGFDCETWQRCVEGLCLTLGVDCHPDCDACDQGVCIMRCSADRACQSRVVCPQSQTCTITCDGVDSCAGGVDCTDATRCNVRCRGEGSCDGPIDCATSDCSVTCTGPGSCTDRVDCTDACACDTTCTGGDARTCVPDCPDGCSSGPDCTSLSSGCDVCETL